MKTFESEQKNFNVDGFSFSNKIFLVVFPPSFDDELVVFLLAFHIDLLVLLFYSSLAIVFVLRFMLNSFINWTTTGWSQSIKFYNDFFGLIVNT